MITDDQALTQIERVLGLPYAPVPDKSSVDDTAIAELCKALIGSTRDLQHAKATIDELMRGERCPVPRDIYSTASSLAPEAQPRNCERCHGTGWEHRKVRTFDKHARRVIEVDASQRCSCSQVATATPEPEERAGGLAKAVAQGFGKDWDD